MVNMGKNELRYETIALVALTVLLLVSSSAIAGWFQAPVGDPDVTKGPVAPRGLGDSPAAEPDEHAWIGLFEELVTAWSGSMTTETTGSAVTPCAETTDKALDSDGAALKALCSVLDRIPHPHMATSSNLDQCEPTTDLCLVDKDETHPADPDCERYRPEDAYGPHGAESTLYLDGSNETHVGAFWDCSYWVLEKNLFFGFRAMGTVEGVDFRIQWNGVDRIPDPDCRWPTISRALEGTQVWIELNGAGADIGLRWVDRTITPCDPDEYTGDRYAWPFKTAGHACFKAIWFDNVWEDLGCEDAPPSPPRKSEFPYGNLTP